MANLVLLRFLAVIRFLDRHLTRLSLVIDRHRWLSLFLNTFVSVCFIGCAVSNLPESPFEAIADLMLAVILFGCFVADVIYLLLDGYAYVLAHRGAIRTAFHRPQPQPKLATPYGKARLALYLFRPVPRKARRGVGASSHR